MTETNPIRTSVRKPVVALCGSSSSTDAMDRVAEELGRGIVSRGWVLLCGGRRGVMEAACRGGQLARTEGGQGLVVGLIPGSDADEANPFCDLVIPSGLGYTRNSLVALAADIVLLVGGSSGTLCEAAYAWQYGKPIIALPETGGWASKLAGQTLDDRRSDCVQAAHTPAEALRLCADYLDRRRRLAP